MSLYPKPRIDRRCFIACPPEVCDCLVGAYYDTDLIIGPADDSNYDVQYPCDVEPPHEVSEDDPHDKPTTDNSSTKKPS